MPHFDLYAPRGDARSDGPDCSLGTVFNCSACGDICPPGHDMATTQRICVDGACGILCDGESYDVNGQLDDGCEAEDDLPLHANAYEARDLGQVSDCVALVQGSGRLPSDDRQHIVAPLERPTGREDWFALSIDDGLCVIQADVTIQLTGLPQSATYQASAYYVCQDGREQPAVSATAAGGESITLQPQIGCAMVVGNDSGQLLLRVAQLSGPHSSGSYTVEIVP